MYKVYIHIYNARAIVIEYSRVRIYTHSAARELIQFVANEYRVSDVAEGQCVCVMELLHTVLRTLI